MGEYSCKGEECPHFAEFDAGVDSPYLGGLAKELCTILHISEEICPAERINEVKAERQLGGQKDA
jgi:hypothetical protein